MRTLLALVVALLAATSAPLPASAADERLVAAEVCPAFRSRVRGTNPGEVATTPGRTYDIVERSADGAWVRLRVEGAPEIEERWVEARCGRTDRAGTARPRTAESTENVLAVNWQPAFCEGDPDLRECALLNRGRLPAAAERFSIHGLWPQPRGNDYCDGIVRGDPVPPLSGTTRGRLVELMPGTASGLDRHQWTRHGSCYRGAGGAEEYFADTVLLVDALNASPVRTLFADSVGDELSRRDVAAAFDAAFGRGAGARVEFDCARDGRRWLLVEMRIRLSGRIAPGVGLGDLIRAADPVRGGDCPARFVVDPPGLQ